MRIKSREIYSNLDVILKSRERVADNTYKLEFTVKSGNFIFEAGQYVWLSIEKLMYPDPTGNRRAFSVASEPQRKNEIEIITRSSDSGFKKTLLETAIGSTLQITGPFGSMSLAKNMGSSERAYLVAGGTGVAPFLSIIRSRLEPGAGPKLVLIYGEANKDSFLPEVLALKDSPAYQGFLKTIFCEGAVSWSFIKEHADIDKSALWYFSGPEEMVRAIAPLALEDGVARSQMVFEENYPYFSFEDKIDLAGADMYKLAVEHSLIHVALTDVNGRIIYANQAAADITGYSIEEMIGKTPRLWGGLMGPEFYRNLWHTVKIERKPYVNKIMNRRKSGEQYIAELSIAPIIIQSTGELVGFSVNEKDITELERVDQEKSEFISIASHQLRTPLAGIHWTIERLMEKKETNVNNLPYLRDIYRATTKLSELVDTLLNVTRIESGAMNINPEPVDIISALDNYFRDYRLLLEEKELSFNFSHRMSRLKIITDQILLQNIVQSIFNNAIEYTPTNGKIEVSLDRKGDHFLLSVKDSGIGIPVDEQGRLFSKFFRASNAKLVKPDGTGIGLFIAGEAVKFLGGKIWCESKLNQGSTFFIDLPLVSRAKNGAEHLKNNQ